MTDDPRQEQVARKLCEIAEGSWDHRDVWMDHAAMLLRTADGDEPIFILRARDVTAPAVILSWAARREALKQQSVKPDADKALVTSARALADNMKNWYLRNRESPVDLAAAYGPHVAGKIAERDRPEQTEGGTPDLGPPLPELPT
jgi:hypothetical protein